MLNIGKSGNYFNIQLLNKTKNRKNLVLDICKPMACILLFALTKIQCKLLRDKTFADLFKEILDC